MLISIQPALHAHLGNYKEKCGQHAEMAVFAREHYA